MKQMVINSGGKKVGMEWQTFHANMMRLFSGPNEAENKESWSQKAGPQTGCFGC